MNDTPEHTTKLLAAYAADKKGADLQVIDLRSVSGYTDFFVICTGGSDRQVKAIHDGIQLGMKRDHRIVPRRVEGATEARWILMDYLDAVVHIFTPDMRDHYRLDQLWGDVPRLAVEPAELDELLVGSSTAGATAS